MSQTDPNTANVDDEGQVKILRSLWEPHPGQLAIMGHPARFRVAACGRRWGKSEMCAHVALARALERPGSLVWWVAPTYDDANDYGFNKMVPLLSPDVVAGSPKRTKPRKISLNNGSEISFRSADREDSLRGAGVDLLIIDESGAVPDRAWKQELRPTLSDTQGDLLAVGTPKAGNWFYEWWQRGQSPEYPDVASWQAPTEQNPHIDDAEIEAAKRELPEGIFRQEYLAEFEAGGKRLRRDMLQFVDIDTVPDEEVSFRVGVDLAIESDPGRARDRDMDYTAAAMVAIAPGGQAYLLDVSQRRGMSLNESVGWIANLVGDIPNPKIFVEDNAAQAWWLQTARDHGLRVTGLTSTRPKAERILFISVPFEQGRIKVVDRPGVDWSPFIAQWMDFDGTDSGHDDLLDATELAIRDTRFTGGITIEAGRAYGER